MDGLSGICGIWHKRKSENQFWFSYGFYDYSFFSTYVTHKADKNADIWSYKQLITTRAINLLPYPSLLDIFNVFYLFEIFLNLALTDWLVLNLKRPLNFSIQQFWLIKVSEVRFHHLKRLSALMSSAFEWLTSCTLSVSIANKNRYMK